MCEMPIYRYITFNDNINDCWHNAHINDKNRIDCLGSELGEQWSGKLREKDIRATVVEVNELERATIECE